MVKKKELMIITNYSQETLLSLDEVCNICATEPAFIEELIEYDIIYPINYAKSQCLFTLSQLKRIKTAQRIQKDLKINLEGIALILDLLEEIERLREKAALLDKYFM